jgi:hypothetical protein
MKKTKRMIDPNTYFDLRVTQFIKSSVKNYEDVPHQKAAALIAFDVQKQFKLVINTCDLVVIGELLKRGVGVRNKPKEGANEKYLRQLQYVFGYYANELDLCVEHVRFVADTEDIVIKVALIEPKSRWPRVPFEKLAAQLFIEPDTTFFKKPNAVCIQGTVKQNYLRHNIPVLVKALIKRNYKVSANGKSNQVNCLL